MLDAYVQRRQQIRSQVDSILKTNGPLPAYKRGALDGLLDEAHSLEQRKVAVAGQWTRGGNTFLKAHELALFKTMQVDKRDLFEAGLPSGTATGSGIFVPPGMQASVISGLKTYSPLLNLCTIDVSDTGGRSFTYPSDLDVNVTAEIQPEFVQVNIGDVSSPGQTLLGGPNMAKFNSKLVRVSRETLADSSIDMVAYLSKILSVRLARGISSYCTTGNGTGQPMGFLNSSTTINAGVAQGAADIDGTSGGTSLGLADLSLLLASIDDLYRANSVFMISLPTLQYMRRQRTTTGAYAWPGLHHSHDRVDTILNRPIVVNSFLDSLQQTASSPAVLKKVIVCADWSEYRVRMTPLILVRLDEAYAEFFECAFMGITRVSANFITQGACCAYLSTSY